MSCEIVVAVAQNGVIGKDGDLPWHLPADMKFFRELTTGNTIIMGRKTHESIGKALPKRVNIVITRDPDYQAEGCIVVNSLEAAIHSNDIQGRKFIIGGSQIYKLAIEAGAVSRIYRTVIEQDFEGDAHLEIDESKWRCVETESFQPDEKNKWPYRFEVLEPA